MSRKAGVDKPRLRYPGKIRSLLDWLVDYRDFSIGPTSVWARNTLLRPNTAHRHTATRKAVGSRTADSTISESSRHELFDLNAEAIRHWGQRMQRQRRIDGLKSAAPVGLSVMAALALTAVLSGGYGSSEVADDLGDMTGSTVEFSGSAPNVNGAIGNKGLAIGYDTTIYSCEASSTTNQIEALLGAIKSPKTDNNDIHFKDWEQFGAQVFASPHDALERLAALDDVEIEEATLVISSPDMSGIESSENTQKLIEWLKAYGYQEITRQAEEISAAYNNNAPEGSPELGNEEMPTELSEFETATITELAKQMQKNGLLEGEGLPVSVRKLFESASLEQSAQLVIKTKSEEKQVIVFNMTWAELLIALAAGVAFSKIVERSRF